MLPASLLVCAGDSITGHIFSRACPPGAFLQLLWKATDTMPQALLRRWGARSWGVERHTDRGCVSRVSQPLHRPSSSSSSSSRRRRRSLSRKNVQLPQVVSLPPKWDGGRGRRRGREGAGAWFMAALAWRGLLVGNRVVPLPRPYPQHARRLEPVRGAVGTGGVATSAAVAKGLGDSVPPTAGQHLKSSVPAQKSGIPSKSSNTSAPPPPPPPPPPLRFVPSASQYSDALSLSLSLSPSVCVCVCVCVCLSVSLSVPLSLSPPPSLSPSVSLSLSLCLSLSLSLSSLCVPPPQRHPPVPMLALSISFSSQLSVCVVSGCLASLRVLCDSACSF